MVISPIYCTKKLRFNQVIRFAFLLIFLILMGNTESSAGSMIIPDRDIISENFFISEDKDGYNNRVHIGILDSEPLVINTVFLDAATTDDDTPDTGSTNVEPEHENPASENRKPDWEGVFRDTSIIFGGQIAAVAITYVLPESFSGWSPEQKKAGAKKYARNFVNPVLDKDKFYVNYVLHPYWGATYYTRARERGLSRSYSLAYSALISALYEFGTECIAEKPSIQDLIVTPVVGSLLGAYIFEPLRDSIKRKQEMRWYDHTVLILTDPLGVISLGFEKLFGIKSTIVVKLPMPQIQNSSTATANNYFGATMEFQLN